MNKQIILIIFSVVLLVGIVSAETETYKLNQETDLKFTCTLNNAIPSAAAEYNITLSYQNGSTFKNSNMTTPLGNGAFNYTTTFTEIGLYKVQMFCWDTTYSYSDEGFYDVTESGNKIPEGMLIVYGVIILIIFGISCIFFILAFKIQDSSLKIFFWLAGFVFLTGCMATITAISYNINPVSAINKIVLVITYILGLITFLIFALVLVQRIISILDMMREKKGYETDF